MDVPPRTRIQRGPRHEWRRNGNRNNQVHKEEECKLQHLIVTYRKHMRACFGNTGFVACSALNVRPHPTLLPNARQLSLTRESSLVC